MHAILASLGTDGDVLPFIGLGVSLKARGHRVTVVAADDYADLVAAHWLEFRSLVSTEKMSELLGNAVFWHPLKTGRFTAKWGSGLIEPQYKVFSAFASDVDAVFITNPAIFAALLAHEKFHRPLVHLVLQPWLIQSASAPPVMPIIGLPLWAPRFVHHWYFNLINFAADVLFAPTLNRLRRSLGLRPIRNLLRNWFSKDLVIGMFPDWYGPPQPDWPAIIQLTGFPLFDGAASRPLPKGLPDFLANEKPTVAFTFGSGMMHGSQLFDAVSRVCAKLNLQGLFINRFQAPSLPAHMFHAPYAPFKEIFPRCAAIVHHGGIGTTAEAFAAGKPQLILPLGFDQLDNAVRVQKLGAGLHLGSKHGLVARKRALSDRKVDQIARVIARLLEPEFKTAAAKMAARVRSQNGLEAAADAVERFVTRR